MNIAEFEDLIHKNNYHSCAPNNKMLRNITFEECKFGDSVTFCQNIFHKTQCFEQNIVLFHFSVIPCMLWPLVTQAGKSIPSFYVVSYKVGNRDIVILAAVYPVSDPVRPKQRSFGHTPSDHLHRHGERRYHQHHNYYTDPN